MHQCGAPVVEGPGVLASIGEVRWFVTRPREKRGATSHDVCHFLAADIFVGLCFFENREPLESGDVFYELRRRFTFGDRLAVPMKGAKPAVSMRASRLSC